MKLLTNYVQSQNHAQPKVINWRENYINDSLFYSCRSTFYDRNTYPSSLHYHDYYELILFQEGDIQYVCESSVYEPSFADMILIPPQKLHMSRINSDSTLYKRHVFYLYRDAFDAIGCSTLSDFLQSTTECHLLTAPDPASKQKVITLLGKLDSALAQKEDPKEQALGLSYVLQIFYLLNQYHVLPCHNSRQLPEKILRLQQYIDSHLSEITSVDQIAAHFFYSREYLSRLFKKHFQTSVSDYIRKRRIAMSQTLISQGMPLLEVCFHVGFDSPSTFIRVFKSITGLTPSKYRQTILKS